ncbi:MAG: bis(5'-nucleosyl)-tetraphosphatase (symmetrical) [Pseudohongiellaceae bacterium]|jgi:bis(5'-nucleosyl)-tetraphosphatase (symmetrical)
MATYAIGDIQGCFATFQALLERIQFNEQADTLWLAGDLVNRGPDSLNLLRWVVAHDSSVVTVLGNHDLHLLSASAGLRQPRARDTLAAVLEADDRDELIDWLRQQPLAHQGVVNGQKLLMVHAGLHPRWTVARALSLADEVCAELTRGDGSELLAALVNTTTSRWEDNLVGAERLTMIVGVLTRLRACHSDGTPCSDFSGPPAEAPMNCLPWHAVPDVAWSDHRVVCGHWAAQDVTLSDRVIAVDSACIWGGSLSAYRLDDGQLFSEPMRDELRPAVATPPRPPQ